MTKNQTPYDECPHCGSEANWDCLNFQYCNNCGWSTEPKSAEAFAMHIEHVYAEPHTDNY
jgi:hypothetical protein